MKNRDEIIRAIGVIVIALHKKQSERDVYRRLGAIEALLIVLGVLELRQTLPFKEVRYTVKPFFGKEREESRSETYKEFILRLATDVLDEPV